jgi:hypothetical protein
MAFVLGLIISAAWLHYGPTLIRDLRQTSHPSSVTEVQHLADLLDRAGLACSFVREPEAARNVGVEQAVLCAHPMGDHHLAIHVSRRELFRGLELMANGMACFMDRPESHSTVYFVHSDRWSIMTTQASTQQALSQLTGASVTAIQCQSASANLAPPLGTTRRAT